MRKFFPPRWKKVIGDLWSVPTRTLLVVLSIGIGVFTVGLLADTQLRIDQGLNAAYGAAKPFSAMMVTDEPFSTDLLNTLRDVPGVEAIDARKQVTVRLRGADDTWETLRLTVIDDFDEIEVSVFTHMSGPWPPPDKTMLIERATPINIGDEVTIEAPDERLRQISVVGTVHDMNVAPTSLMNIYYGYITMDTAEWLGLSRDFDSLYMRVTSERFTDVDYTREVVREVRQKIERSGHTVGVTFIPPEPGRSPIATIALDPLHFILSVVSVLVVFLSGFLVTNTISGLLAQQVRYIGIMKAVGAQTQQVIGMYLGLVVGFGILALILAVPLSAIGAGMLTRLFANLLNFDAPGYTLSMSVLLPQVFVSLIVPVIAALYPVLQGSQVTIREALDNSIATVSGKKSPIDRLLHRLRGIPRPIMLSLRNTFRRKARLGLTLLTLVLSGGTFIGVLSVQESVRASLDQLYAALIRYDISVNFEQSYRVEQVEQELMLIPGVEHIESWGITGVRRPRPDGTESESIDLIAPPEMTELLQPEIVEGRWLVPGDENALVLSLGVFDDEPDIAVGDTITLDINGRMTEWVIVGAFKAMSNDELLAYTTQHVYEQATRKPGQTETVQIVTIYDQFDRENQAHVAQQIEAHLQAVGLEVRSTETASQSYDQSLNRFSIIVYALLIMALLAAMVGGIGLSGTMSLNVLERTREIGVMRAIGASNQAIQQMTITEGIVISLLGWLCSAMAALPIGNMLANGVGYLFLGTPLSYAYSFWGALFWLGIAIVLALLASMLPAWNATRLTIREVLTYE